MSVHLLKIIMYNMLYKNFCNEKISTLPYSYYNTNVNPGVGVFCDCDNFFLLHSCYIFLILKFFIKISKVATLWMEIVYFELRTFINMYIGISFFCFFLNYCYRCLRFPISMHICTYKLICLTLWGSASLIHLKLSTFCFFGSFIKWEYLWE